LKRVHWSECRDVYRASRKSEIMGIAVLSKGAA
jgi:hypothetical protein